MDTENGEVARNTLEDEYQLVHLIIMPPENGGTLVDTKNLAELCKTAYTPDIT